MSNRVILTGTGLGLRLPAGDITLGSEYLRVRLAL